jgi:glutamate carboxypeptidase
MPASMLDSALTWLSAQRFAMSRMLERLARQNSFTRHSEGVNAVVAILAAELERLGLAPQRIPSARFGDHLAFDTAAPGPAIFLIGHTDTVFAPGTFETWRAEGDLACGPGVCDMKGGLVVTLFALEALARGGLLDRVPLRGLWVSDEETGSPESQAITRARVQGCACALGFESGRAEDRIVTRRKGLASLEVQARGIPAHAGNAHHRGRSAIWSLARFVDRVQSLTDYASGVTVNVGMIEGGTTRNTVPAHACCEVDVRFLTAADGVRIAQEIERAASSTALEGTRLEVRPSSSRPPLERTEASAALAVEYGACQAESGLGSGEAPLAGGGSDASTTSAAGVPSIDGLGPRGSGFHTPEETIDLGSLVPKAAALVRFLARRAGDRVVV